METLSLTFEGIDKDGFLALILNEQCTLVNKCDYLDGVVTVNTTREYIDSLDIAPVTCSYKLNNYIPVGLDLPPTTWNEVKAIGTTGDYTGRTWENVVNFSHAFHTNQFRTSNERLGIYRRANTRQGGTVPNANLVEYNTTNARREFILAPNAKDSVLYYREGPLDKLIVTEELLTNGFFKVVNWENKIPVALVFSSYSKTSTGFSYWSSTYPGLHTYADSDNNYEIYSILERKDDPKRFFRLKMKSGRNYKRLNYDDNTTYTMYQLDVDTDHEINIGYQLQDDDIGKTWIIKCIRDVVSDEFSGPITKLVTPFTGKDVDIVCLEAYDQNNLLPDGYHFHYDYRDTLGSGTRLIPMNWSTEYGAPNPTDNDQIGKNKILPAHGVGVLSVAGGVIGGFGKNSTLRIMTFTNDVAGCINAIIAWHNSKEVDPVTGQRRPTILNNSWGYTFYHDYHILLSDLEQVLKYTPDGLKIFDRTDTSVPAITVDNLHAAGVPVRRVYVGTAYNWCVPTPVTVEDTVLYANPASNPWEGIWKNVKDNGITVVVSAGNSAGIVAGRHLEESGDLLRIKANGKIYRSDRKWNTLQLGTQVLHKTYTSIQDIYPQWIQNSAGTSQAITVAALQMSDSQPHLDTYSNRGEGITVVAAGDGNLAASPYINPIFRDSLNGGYNFFGGTSAAAPLVSGMLACMSEKFKYLRGYWPDTNTLNYYLIHHSIKNKIRRSDPFNANTGTTKSAVTTWKVESFAKGIQTVKTITTATFANGGIVETILGKTPNRIAYFDQTYFKPLDCTKVKPAAYEGVTLRHPLLNKRYAV